MNTNDKKYLIALFKKALEAERIYSRSLTKLPIGEVTKLLHEAAEAVIKFEKEIDNI